MTNTTFLHTMKHYVGKIRTIRNEIRTQRFLATLPPEIRKDIGYPDLDMFGR